MVLKILLSHMIIKIQLLITDNNEQLDYFLLYNMFTNKNLVYYVFDIVGPFIQIIFQSC